MSAGINWLPTGKAKFETKNGKLYRLLEKRNIDTGEKRYFNI
jgi:hypothetical protein